MDAENNSRDSEFTPVKSVLKGSSVKTKRPKKSWTSGMFMIFGIMLIISGGLISATVGSIIAKIAFLAGLAIFTLALLIKTINLAMLIYYERHE